MRASWRGSSWNVAIGMSAAVLGVALLVIGVFMWRSGQSLGVTTAVLGLVAALLGALRVGFGWAANKPDDHLS